MRRLVSALTAALLCLGLFAGVALAAEGNGKTETKNLGTFQVQLTTPADGLRVGGGELALTLRDRASGQAVVRDSVRVEVLMNAADKSMNHGDMSKQAPVSLQLQADKANPGRYVGQANFSDAGEWLVQVYADTRAGQAPVTFSVDVAGGGPNWLVVGGILAFVAAAVVVGARLMRRKPAPQLVGAVKAV